MAVRVNMPRLWHPHQVWEMHLTRWATYALSGESRAKAWFANGKARREAREQYEAKHP